MSSAIILLGGVFVIDSLLSWDNFAVVSDIAGWAVAVTGVLHLFIALGGHGGKPVRWLAASSGIILVVLVVSGWVFASFGRDWPEIASVALLAIAITLAMVEKG